MLSYAHHYAVFWEYGGGGFFILSVTRGIVFLFFVRIAAVLLLRNASFRTFLCFFRTLCCFLELLYLLSIVDSLVVLIMWNHSNNNGNFLVDCKFSYIYKTMISVSVIQDAYRLSVEGFKILNLN
jgi:hypothetical protein